MSQYGYQYAHDGYQYGETNVVEQLSTDQLNDLSFMSGFRASKAVQNALTLLSTEQEIPSLSDTTVIKTLAAAKAGYQDGLKGVYLPDQNNSSFI